MSSHPTWVRGLKQVKKSNVKRHRQSHPTWVRGLKPCIANCHLARIVAPYVGAWIETQYHYQKKLAKLVAPYVGAWIETYTL